MKKKERIKELETQIEDLREERKEREKKIEELEEELEDEHGKTECLEVEIEELERDIAKLEEEQSIYKFFISRLQKIDHQKDERKKLIIDTIGINKPYTIPESDLMNDVKDWLRM